MKICNYSKVCTKRKNVKVEYIEFLENNSIFFLKGKLTLLKLDVFSMKVFQVFNF